MTGIKLILIALLASLSEAYGTEVAIISAVAVVGWIGYHIYKHYKHVRTLQQNPDPERAERTRNTRELMADTLRQMGCQPASEKDDELQVSYQGEHLILKFDGQYVKIWDLYWTYVNVNSPDLPVYMGAVNLANLDFGATVVASDPDEQNNIYLSSHRDMVFFPEYRDKTDFVRAVLDSLFTTKDNVRRHFSTLSARPSAPQPDRRPIGFTTESQE